MQLRWTEEAADDLAASPIIYLRTRQAVQPRSCVKFTTPRLASWCGPGGWISGLPVAEAVPMLFRMGPDRYSPGSDFGGPLCRSSVGISTDEFPSRIPSGRRVYVFNPRAWSPDELQAVLRKVRRWQSAF
jgi:hypothetical protein